VNRNLFERSEVACCPFLRDPPVLQRDANLVNLVLQQSKARAYDACVL
jgi:hypothetical protein